MRAAHELPARSRIEGLLHVVLRVHAADGATEQPHRQHDEQDEDQEPTHGLIIIAKMKILVAVPGRLQTVSMNRFVPEALGSLGHQVRVADYSPTFFEKLRRKLAGRETAEVVAPRLLAAVEEHKPDLFLTLYGVNVSHAVLTELKRRRITTANWWLNDPFQWARATKILGHYDHAFTNAKYSVDAYAAAGMKHVHFLPSACDASVHRPLERPIECDLSFAGDWSANREQIVEQLVAAGVDVRVHGPWRRKLRQGSALQERLEHGFFTPERMVEIFAGSRATLNIHTWRGRFDYGLNPRVFEAGASGTPQLVDHKRELDEIFGPGERAGMLIYRSDEELLDLARSLKGRAAELKSAALAAASTFQRDHSYRARMAELLRVVNA